jgi:prevent-host-death family protein
MKTLDLKRDLIPVSEFRSNAAALLKRLQEGDRLILTQNGKAAGVLLGVDEYQEMEVRMKELETIVFGLLDLRKGKADLMDHADFMNQLTEEIKRAG